MVSLRSCDAESQARRRTTYFNLQVLSLYERCNAQMKDGGWDFACG